MWLTIGLVAAAAVSVAAVRIVVMLLASERSPSRGVEVERGAWTLS
jgi:hypothetical protein